MICYFLTIRLGYHMYFQIILLPNNNNRAWIFNNKSNNNNNNNNNNNYFSNCFFEISYNCCYTGIMCGYNIKPIECYYF
eukprot:UN01144